MAGLYEKYKIEKTDGTPMDPAAKYIVLRVDKDAEAREALFYYVSLVLSNKEREKKDGQFVQDLTKLCTDLEIAAEEEKFGVKFNMDCSYCDCPTHKSLIRKCKRCGRTGCHACIPEGMCEECVEIVGEKERSSMGLALERTRDLTSEG